MAWETFTYGPVEMEVKMTIAIVTATLLPCGLFQLILQLTMARMPITTSRALQPWLPPLATERKILTPEL